MRPLPEHFTGSCVEPLTGPEAREARRALGLSAAQLAAIFHHKQNEDLGRTVRRWEQVGPSQAVSLALRYLLALHSAETPKDR